MRLIRSENASENYLAKVVEITEFSPHPNPEYTRLKVAHVDGYDVIVGIDETEGKYVYFPTSCKINPKLLSYANLYRHGEFNEDPEKKGMFDDNGRVKAISLGKKVSYGFLLPLTILQNFVVSSVNVELSDDACPSGFEFDEVEHNGKSFWINQKYIVVSSFKNKGVSSGSGKGKNKLKRFSRLVEGQFNFHYDTVLIRKMPEMISPEDLIQLTFKVHGTSGIFSNVLCKHPLSLKEKIARLLTGNEFLRYENIYSSRKVIKNADINPKAKDTGFYGDDGDVWSHANKVISPYLTKGMTIYAEIIGFAPNGRYIQNQYDYGCIPPKENEEYTYGKHYKIFIYRITITDPDGSIHDFSAREVQQWCKRKELIPVQECYYGKAADLYPDIEKDENWSVNFIDRLADDKRFFMELNSPDCSNKVPHEGLVIKKEDMISRAWKLKCFAFLKGEQAELDKGNTNMEDDQ